MHLNVERSERKENSWRNLYAGISFRFVIEMSFLFCLNSLNNYRRFFSSSSSSEPRVKQYSRDDIMATMEWALDTITLTSSFMSTSTRWNYAHIIDRALRMIMAHYLMGSRGFLKNNFWKKSFCGIIELNCSMWKEENRCVIV